MGKILDWIKSDFKRTTKRQWVAIGIVVVVVFVILVIIYVNRPNSYEFVSHNGVLGCESVYPEIRYNYTVYVKIKNNLMTEPITIYCEITREDLTTITKQRTIYLDKGESVTIKFFFSNQDLKGASPHQYKLYGE